MSNLLIYITLGRTGHLPSVIQSLAHRLTQLAIPALVETITTLGSTSVSIPSRALDISLTNDIQHLPGNTVSLHHTQ